MSADRMPDWMPEGSKRHRNPDGTVGGWVAPTAYVGQHATPEPRHVTVAEIDGALAGGPDSVTWLREQRGLHMREDTDE